MTKAKIIKKIPVTPHDKTRVVVEAFDSISGKNRKEKAKKIKKELKTISKKEKKLKSEKEIIAKKIKEVNDNITKSKKANLVEIVLGEKLLNPKSFKEGNDVVDDLTAKFIDEKRQTILINDTIPIKIFENHKKEFSKLKTSDKPINELTYPLDEKGRPKNPLYLTAPQENHTIIIGATGSGKTAFSLLPTILLMGMASDTPSIVVTDPKGEIYSATSKWMQMNGYSVRILNLTSTLKVSGEYWNPLSELKILYNRFLSIEALLKNIHDADGVETGVEQLFEDKRSRALIADIYYSALKPETHKNFERAIIRFVENPFPKISANNARNIHDDPPFETFGDEDPHVQTNPYIYVIGGKVAVSTELFEEKLHVALKLAKDQIEQERDDLMKNTISTFVQSDEGGGNNNEAFWDNQSNRYLGFWIEMFLYDDECILDRFSLQNVKNYIDIFQGVTDDGSPVPQIITDCREYIKQQLNKYEAKYRKEHPAKERATEWIEPPGSKATFSSSLSSVSSKIEPFLKAGNFVSSSKSTINFSDIVKKKTIFYVVKPDSDKSKDAYVTLFFVSLYKAITNYSYTVPGAKLKHLCYFIIEEFASMPKFKDFDNQITIARGRGIRFWLILQSYNQLVKRYQEGASTIESNCNTHLWCGTKDGDARNKFKKKLGTSTFIKFDPEKVDREEVEKWADDDSVFKMTKEECPIINDLSREDIEVISKDYEFEVDKNNFQRKFISDMDGHKPIRSLVVPFFENKRKIYASADLAGTMARDTSMEKWNKEHKYDITKHIVRKKPTPTTMGDSSKMRSYRNSAGTRPGAGAGIKSGLRTAGKDPQAFATNRRILNDRLKKRNGNKQPTTTTTPINKINITNQKPFDASVLNSPTKKENTIFKPKDQYKTDPAKLYGDKYSDEMDVSNIPYEGGSHSLPTHNIEDHLDFTRSKEEHAIKKHEDMLNNVSNLDEYDEITKDSNSEKDEDNVSSLSSSFMSRTSNVNSKDKSDDISDARTYNAILDEDFDESSLYDSNRNAAPAQPTPVIVNIPQQNQQPVQKNTTSDEDLKKLLDPIYDKQKKQDDNIEEIKNLLKNKDSNNNDDLMKLLREQALVNSMKQQPAPQTQFIPMPFSPMYQPQHQQPAQPQQNNNDQPFIPNFQLDRNKRIIYNPYNGDDISKSPTIFQPSPNVPFVFNPYDGKKLIIDKPDTQPQPVQPQQPIITPQMTTMNFNPLGDSSKMSFQRALNNVRSSKKANPYESENPNIVNAKKRKPKNMGLDPLAIIRTRIAED